MLEVRELTARYGHIAAVRGVSFDAARGEMVAILGPNGAGKSTLLRAIAGLVPPHVEGSITFEGTSIVGLPAEARARLGISIVLEGRRIFPSLSVLENLELGTYIRRQRDDSAFDRVFELFPVLEQRLEQKAGSLSGGEQQMLAIARALVADPSLLVLDEPSFGLAPKVVRTIFDAIDGVRKDTGLTVILVEQDALLALNYCDRAFIMTTGTIALSGSASELREDERLLKVYLGGEHA
jgi:branched-chain amino acid transport system ATP-binding protein